MATIASVDIALTASSVGLNRALTEAEARTQRYTRRAMSAYDRLNRSISGLTNGFAAFVALLGTNQILQQTDELFKFSQTTGIAFDAVQRLNFALSQSGVQFNQLRRLLPTLARNINDFTQDTGEAVDAFEALNIQVSDLEGLGIDQQLFVILRALGMVEDGTTRLALATDILGGRFATSIGAIIADLDQLEEIGSQATIFTPEQGATIVAFNDAVSRLRELFVAVVQAATPLLNVLTPIFNTLASFNTVIGGIIQLGFIVWITRIAVILGGRLRAAISTANAALANQSRQWLIATTASAAYGGAVGSVGRTVFQATGRIVGFTRAFTVFSRVARIAAVAARALGAALRFLGGPIGLIIIAVETLIFLFGDQLVAVFRTAVNFVVRQLNRLISGIDELLQFFGADGIQFRFEEWSQSTEAVADTLPEVAAGIDEVTEAASEAEPMLNSFQQSIEDLSDLTDEYADLSTSTFNRLSDTITDFVTTGSADIQSFVRDTLRAFVQLQVRAALFNAAGAAGLGSIFGRQFGGPVNAGQPYIVGERGPELFVPNQTGNVVRNSQLGGGGNVTYNIQAVDARSFQQLVAEDPAFLYNVTQRGRRELGVT